MKKSKEGHGQKTLVITSHTLEMTCVMQEHWLKYQIISMLA